MYPVGKIDEVCELALQAFGIKKQKAKAIEELAELIAALAKEVNGGSKTNIIDEIADVFIIARQLRIIYGEAWVDSRILFKLERLKGFIAAQNEPMY